VHVLVNITHGRAFPVLAFRGMLCGG